MSDSAHGSVPRFLANSRSGDKHALDQMVPLVYEELHRLARHYLRMERPGHTLQPTALVNEAYLRLVGQHRVDWENRAQLLGVAASMMRRILVNHARERSAAKRGSHAQRVSLSLAGESLGKRDVDLIELNEALERLTQLDARKSRVVELKFFGGLTGDEIAQVMQLSVATVEREWSFARAWLHAEMKSGA